MGIFSKSSGRSSQMNTLLAQAALLQQGAGSPIPEGIVGSMAAQGMNTNQAFGPGQPISPFFGYGAQPRQWDFRTGYNIITQPRDEEGRMSFAALAEMYRAYDVAQLCVETRVNDFRALDWQIVAKKGVKRNVVDQIDKAEALVAKPDGINSYMDWIAVLLRDMFVFDAPAIYRMRNRDNSCRGLKVISGATIAPLIDYYGDLPEPDAPAYVQFIQGLPWDWLSTEDIVYRPMWKYAESSYGWPPLERMLLNSNLDVRFQWYWMQTFSANSVPAGFVTAPPDLSSAEQLKEWQVFWDTMMLGDQSQKQQIRFMPNGSEFVQTKPTEYSSAMSSFLMKKTCAVYGVTPTRLGFSEDVNRATSETQADIDKNNLRPVANWVEEIFNRYLMDDCGLKDVQLQIDDGGEEEDKLTIAQAHDIYIRNGVMGIDEVRSDELGLPIDIENPTPRLVETRTGLMPLKALNEAAAAIDEGTQGGGAFTPTVIEGADGDSTEQPTDSALVVRESPNKVVGTDKPIGDKDNAQTKEAVVKAFDLWRSSSVDRMKRGRPLRKFSDIPDDVAEPVWSQLQKAKDASEVSDIFAKARPGIARL